MDKKYKNKETKSFLDLKRRLLVTGNGRNGLSLTNRSFISEFKGDDRRRPIIEWSGLRLMGIKGRRKECEIQANNTETEKVNDVINGP